MGPEVARAARGDGVAVLAEAALEPMGDGDGGSPAQDGGQEPSQAPRALPLDRVLEGVVTSLDPGARTADVALAPGFVGRVYLSDVSWAREPNPKRRPRKVKRIEDVCNQFSYR